MGLYAFGTNLVTYGSQFVSYVRESANAGYDSIGTSVSGWKSWVADGGNSLLASGGRQINSLKQYVEPCLNNPNCNAEFKTGGALIAAGIATIILAKRQCSVAKPVMKRKIRRTSIQTDSRSGIVKNYEGKQRCKIALITLGVVSIAVGVANMGYAMLQSK